MAAPTAYTETGLAAYMLATLGKVAEVLDWRLLPDVEEAVNDVLLLYGVDAIEDAEDIPKLRALARVAAWRAAVASLSALYTFSDPEGSYTRVQMREGAERALRAAEAEASRWLPVTYAVEITPIAYTSDPYGALDGAEWSAR